MRGRIVVGGSIAVAALLVLVSFSCVADAQTTKITQIEKINVVQTLKEKINGTDGNGTVFWKMILISIITIVLLYKFRVLGALFLFIMNLDAGNLIEILYYFFGILTGNLELTPPTEPSE